MNPRGFPRHTMGNSAFFSAQPRRFRARGHFEDRFRFERAPIGRTCAAQALCERDRRNESAERPQARQLESHSRCRILSSVRTRLTSLSLQILRPLDPPRPTRGNGGAPVRRSRRFVLDAPSCRELLCHPLRNHCGMVIWKVVDRHLDPKHATPWRLAGDNPHGLPIQSAVLSRDELQYRSWQFLTELVLKGPLRCERISPLAILSAA